MMNLNNNNSNGKGSNYARAAAVLCVYSNEFGRVEFTDFNECMEFADGCTGGAFDRPRVCVEFDPRATVRECVDSIEYTSDRADEFARRIANGEQLHSAGAALAAAKFADELEFIAAMSDDNGCYIRETDRARRVRRDGWAQFVELVSEF